jgi:hypothetical protein
MTPGQVAFWTYAAGVGLAAAGLYVWIDRPPRSLSTCVFLGLFWPLVPMVAVGVCVGRALKRGGR